jgi:hypothetical protein
MQTRRSVPEFVARGCRRARLPSDFTFDLGIVKVQELVPFGFGVIAQLLFHFEETRIREGRPVMAADVERGKNDRNPRRATLFLSSSASTSIFETRASPFRFIAYNA